MTRSISSFINTIAANGGMSMSNNYDVEFDFSGITALDTGEGQAASKGPGDCVVVDVVAEQTGGQKVNHVQDKSMNIS